MTATSRRPASLHEVSVRVSNGDQPFDSALREFLDTFYGRPEDREAALRMRPVSLDDVKDAYLAATAEYLAGAFSIQEPDWCESHGHALRRPFFAGGLESLKALLTVESPAAFRRRLLFVSKDALFRPRMVAQAD